MQRSTQDQNRPRPLARLIPPGSRHRSMSALTTRPVRHSAPLPLSIVAGPHEAGPIRSWRADSLAFVWLDPELPHVAKLGKRRLTRNNRIGAKDLLNRCCALVAVLESMLPARAPKIVLQQNRRLSGRVATAP